MVAMRKSCITAFRRTDLCLLLLVLSVTLGRAQTVDCTAPAYASLPYNESFETAWASVCDVKDVPNNYWRNSPATGNNSWRRNDDPVSAKWASAGGTYSP